MREENTRYVSPSGLWVKFREDGTRGIAGFWDFDPGLKEAKKYVQVVTAEFDSENYWFSDTDKEKKEGARWQPVLRIGGVMCLPLPIYSETEQQCNEFIMREIIGARFRI